MLKKTYLTSSLAIVSLLSISFSCQDDSFSGGNASKKEEPQQQAPVPSPSPQSPSLGSSANPQPNPTFSEPIKPTFSIPQNAQTAGRFSAWAEPSQPKEGQEYFIHILVTLPSNTTSYQYSNLKGRVDGTDKYWRSIGPGAVEQNGYSPNPPQPVSVPDQFNFYGNSAKVVLRVPGAQKLVEDTIDITSTNPNASEKIVIRFN